MSGTGFDVHIPSNTIRTIGPWALALIMGASSGGGLATLFDVTGAKAYKESVSVEVAENERLKARVIALEAQQEILVGLVDSCMVE